MEKELGKVYCIVTIDVFEFDGFSVQMYSESRYGSPTSGEWWYYEGEYGGGKWFYDFSYKPSISEIIEVLLPKLKELGYE